MKCAKESARCLLDVEDFGFESLEVIKSNIEDCIDSEQVKKRTLNDKTGTCEA